MANGYSAGDLTLSIDSTAEETIKSLDAIIERLDLINRGLGGIKGNSYVKNTSRSTSKSNSIFNFAKFGVYLHLAKRLGSAMADLVQAGSDYTETLNLWQVAMRDNLDVADQFINKMNKAYGISTKTLMNAQAVFKNMIGSLGQISDATAYALSEALVQMSADYASLYNRTLESAFQNMQSMLAGQVRPIRSAGLDMTETTLFQFYQQLGGTKTMRQLNRTEKQLLSILAVYKQMGSAGALGDMSKTLNQFANQSRMMTEYWAELKTWSGLLLKDLVDQSGMLIYINALLITATEIIKAIAKSRGIGEESFIDGLFETTSATNDEVDELQGKLLDFDKFRSLEGATASPLAIDEKLLEAITGYSSHIDQAQNKAHQLAKEWLAILGFTEDANGQFVISEENLKNIEGKFKGILGLVSAVSAFIFTQKAFKNTWLSAIIAVFAYGYAASDKFAQSINNVGKSLAISIIPIMDSIISILTPLVELSVPIFEIVAEFITLLDNVKLLEPILWGILGSLILIKGIQLKDAIVKFAFSLDGIIQKLKDLPLKINKSTLSLQTHKLSIQQVTAAMGAMLLAYSAAGYILNQFEGSEKTIVAWAFVIVGAITALTAALIAFYTAASWGTMLPLLLAGIGLAVAGTEALMPKVEYYATGAGDIDSGTLFVAGEMGKTEAVYTGSNGKTNVANVRQMEQAFYNALSRHSREGNGTIVVQAYLDGEKVYENTTAKAKARGKVWAKA